MKKPLVLKPVLKDIIWGGTRLSTEYGKAEPGKKIAESWELTSRNDGDNIIVGGEYDGKLFSEYLKENPDAVSDTWDGERFPLLIKLIDAESDLSIQVHPDDKYAAEHTDDLGKTEMWYIVDARPDARIIYGFKKKYTRSEIEKAIAEGTLEELMNYVPVKKGETYFIPSGMVHAICRGILIAEIQQNSNITYRVYDYNRPGPDGKPRQLHVNDALNVFDSTDPEGVKSDWGGNIIAKCKYFTVSKYENKTIKQCADKKSFAHILCADGEADIVCGGEKYVLHAGQSLFIPAGSGEYTAGSDKCVMLVSTL